MLAVTGCAKSGGMPSSVDQTSTTTNPAVQAGLPGEGQLQSFNERQLVIVSLNLIQMDKREDLRMTEEQAKRILAIVQTAIEDGRLSMEKRRAVLDVLNPTQRWFLDELSMEMRLRVARKPGPPPGPPLSEDERLALAKELEERRQAEPEHDWPIPPSSGAPPPGMEMQADKSVEQQLVDLLVSKLQ